MCAAFAPPGWAWLVDAVRLRSAVSPAAPATTSPSTPVRASGRRAMRALVAQWVVHATREAQSRTGVREERKTNTLIVWVLALCAWPVRALRHMGKQQPVSSNEMGVPARDTPLYRSLYFAEEAVPQRGGAPDGVAGESARGKESVRNTTRETRAPVQEEKPYSYSALYRSLYFLGEGEGEGDGALAHAGSAQWCAPALGERRAKRCAELFALDVVPDFLVNDSSSESRLRLDAMRKAWREQAATKEAKRAGLFGVGKAIAALAVNFMMIIPIGH